MTIPADTFVVAAEHDDLTLAAVLRQRLPGRSWSQVRRLIETRHACVGGDLCLDAARRVHVGETVALLDRPAARPRQAEQVVIRHLDHDLVVVEKPAGMCTVRHPAERDWKERRKELSPTLEDIVPRLIAKEEQPGRRDPARLRVVQRLDKETSGLVAFARTVEAERGLGRQFHRHTVTRRYLAVVPGRLRPQRIATRLVRDRGDGRRGSTDVESAGKEAVTDVDVVERLSGYTLLSCRLETGRTHQIRIHLAELGHPVCGDKVYVHRRDGTLFPDHSGAPRLALHAAELGFKHPVSGEPMHWTMPLPADLEALVERLRGATEGDKPPRRRERQGRHVEGKPGDH
jgi:23S rRNA pseudouridine1911/1915/1917 synthase